MKKLLCIIAVLFITLSLPACSDTKTDQTTEIPPAENETITHRIINDTEPADPEQNSTSSGNVLENVLYDKDGIKITASEPKLSEERAEFEICFENNTEEQFTFSMSDFSANGYMLYSTGNYSYFRLDPGNSNSDKIIVYQSDFERFGFTDIADVEFNVSAENESYETVFEELFRIETEKHDGFDYSTDTYAKRLSEGIPPQYGYTIVDFAEDMVYDEGGIKIISEALFRYDDETILWLEAENNSAEAVNAFVPTVSVNGIFAKSSAGEYIMPGKKAVIEISTDELFPANISDVLGLGTAENFVVSFVVCDEIYHALTEEKYLTFGYSDSNTPIDTSGEEVYNKNGVRIISKGMVQNSEYDPPFDAAAWLLFLAENKSGGEIQIEDDWHGEFSLNGKEAYLTFSADIPDGEYGLLSITVYDNDLEEAGLSSADEIENFTADICVYGDNIDDTSEISVKY